MKLPARQLPNRTIETVVASAVVGLGVAALINGALARRAERRNPPNLDFSNAGGASGLRI